MVLSVKEVHLNEINNISILQPDIGKISFELSEEVEVYVRKLHQMEVLANKTAELVQKYSHVIDAEEMRAIGAKNLLHGMKKHKQNNEEGIDEMYDELLIEIERLKVQISSLRKTEIQQNETIANIDPLIFKMNLQI